VSRQVLCWTVIGTSPGLSEPIAEMEGQSIALKVSRWPDPGVVRAETLWPSTEDMTVEIA
jgi:hypothetical protein